MKYLLKGVSLKKSLVKEIFLTADFFDIQKHQKCVQKFYNVPLEKGVLLLQTKINND